MLFAYKKKSTPTSSLPSGIEKKSISRLSRVQRVIQKKIQTSDCNDIQVERIINIWKKVQESSYIPEYPGKMCKEDVDELKGEIQKYNYNPTNILEQFRFC